MERISKNIKKAVDNFLGENADVFGFAYVLDVIMSQDNREAKVFVHFEDNPVERVKLLEKKKGAISQAINGLISMRYPPRIKIEGVSNETLNL